MAESVNTLRYAGRAMNIKNTAVKNEGIAGAPVSYAEVGTCKWYTKILSKYCFVFLPSSSFVIF